MSRAGFSLRGPAEAVIPLARITRWGTDASDFFRRGRAADASAVTNRTDGVIRIVVATRDGARLASMLRNHAIRALRADRRGSRGGGPARESATIGGGRGAHRCGIALETAEAAKRTSTSAAGHARETGPARGDVAATVVQARWRSARRLAWRREESALVLRASGADVQHEASQLTSRE